MAIAIHSLALISLISLSLLSTSKAQSPAAAPLLPPPSTAEPTPAPATEPVLSPAAAPGFGPSAAPAPVDPCMDSFLNMSDCLTYVETGSTVRVPDKGCCPAFSSLVDNQPQCLCQIIGSGEVIGFKIDTTKALTLPTACRVQTPSVSLCSLFGIPIASPASTPGQLLAPGATIGSSPTNGPAPSGSKKNKANVLLFGFIFCIFFLF